ncbi:MAG: ROK family protein [Subdoligranulum sp.]
MTGGRLLEGARGLGGELGHFRLHALDGVACTCGAIGCYERYAATTALVRDAQKMGLDAPDGRTIFEVRCRGRRPHAGCAQRLDQRDRPGPCGPCTHLQPAA